MYWARSSGIKSDSAVARKHEDFMNVFAHLVQFDQVNPGKLAGCESIARHILQIHAATRRNPEFPDFTGTELMVQSTLDSKGGELHGDFADWTAEKQKQRAFTLKQHRLYAEEQGHRDQPAAGPNKNKKK